MFGSPADQVFLPSGIVVMSYISDRSIWCQPAADKTPCEELQLLVLHCTQAWEQLWTGTADCHKGEMQELLE